MHSYSGPPLEGAVPGLGVVSHDGQVIGELGRLGSPLARVQSRRLIWIKESLGCRTYRSVSDQGAATGLGDETMMPDGSMIIAIIFVGILWVFLGACVWRMSHPAPNRDPRRD
jgi:hypothetical protein